MGGKGCVLGGSEKCAHNPRGRWVSAQKKTKKQNKTKFSLIDLRVCNFSFKIHFFLGGNLLVFVQLASY